MHELGLCRAIATIAEQHAEGRPVRRVHVRVGRLRQVLPRTLEGDWQFVSGSEALRGSELVVTVSDGDELLVDSIDLAPSRRD